MIAGIGIDICRRDRFVHRLDDHAFLGKIFHAQELAMLPHRGEDALGKSAFLAGRWAAKESLVKALGLGIFVLPLSQMCVVLACNRAGAPQWQFGPDVRAVLQERGIHHVFLSLSHEADLVAAVSVLET